LLVSAAALPILVALAWAHESATRAAGALVPGVASAAAAAEPETRKSAPPGSRAPLVHMPPTEARVVAEAKPSDWRPLDPQNTLYLQLPAGRVVIELAPRFAPQYVANIKKLVRDHYFDGLAMERVQDNFVVQWGDPDHSRSLGTAEKTLPAEFIVSSKDVPFTPLPDPDTYAPEVGFAGEFPAARDPKIGREWLVHCYGMVGAGRDDDVESGNGSEIYAVIGHAPRQLDRNVALVGRVVEGMERLSSLPRGSGQLGFYTSRERRVPIESIRLAADVPPDQRSHLEVLRTDTRTFAALIEARRNRRDSWYKVPAGRIDVCNVPIPARSR
jgi:peptidylprolyl isomerase